MRGKNQFPFRKRRAETSSTENRLIEAKHHPELFFDISEYLLNMQLEIQTPDSRAGARSLVFLWNRVMLPGARQDSIRTLASSRMSGTFSLSNSSRNLPLNDLVHSFSRSEDPDSVRCPKAGHEPGLRLENN